LTGISPLLSSPRLHCPWSSNVVSLCTIWGVYSVGYEEFCLLWYAAVQSASSWEHIAPKNKPSTCSK
jgi:hypothetical protein